MFSSLFGFLERHLPKLVVLPSFLICVVFIYGFILWTFWISLTSSKLLPNNNFIGLEQYFRLFSNERWWTALTNLGLFSVLFMGICLGLGMFMAILLDQQIRAEGFIRTIYLYPMALSFIVSGTAWKWILNPTIGIEKLVQDLGWESFEFDWLVNPDYSVYTLVIAAVWQSSGFVMALFLAGLRSIDSNIVKAAQIDGASLPQVYRRIILPCMGATFFSCLIILSHIAIKSFDLVMALTGGGPGYSSDLPATFMYTYSFTRSRLALGASSAVIMLLMVLSILIPYLYSELRKK